MSTITGLTTSTLLSEDTPLPHRQAKKPRTSSSSSSSSSGPMMIDLSPPKPATNILTDRHRREIRRAIIPTISADSHINRLEDAIIPKIKASIANNHPIHFVKATQKLPIHDKLLQEYKNMIDEWRKTQVVYLDNLLMQFKERELRMLKENRAKAIDAVLDDLAEDISHDLASKSVNADDDAVYDEIKANVEMIRGEEMKKTIQERNEKTKEDENRRLQQDEEKLNLLNLPISDVNRELLAFNRQQPNYHNRRDNRRSSFRQQQQQHRHRSLSRASRFSQSSHRNQRQDHNQRGNNNNQRGNYNNPYRNNRSRPRHRSRSQASFRHQRSRSRPQRRPQSRNRRVRF